MSDSRLDSVLGDRGLARSRTHAARLIADGLVTVDGKPQVKPSFRVREGQVVEVAESDHYVSRAAHKLVAALDAFPIEVHDRLALDVGASTGGFTQVLLERGARRVISLDVGHGQLVPEIANDPRVVVVEGENARYLTPVQLAHSSGVTEIPTLLVADLSFISLPTVMPAMVDTVGRDADFVLLIKPQFEVGRGGIREGIVRDQRLRQDAVSAVLWAAWDLGLGTAGLIPSPIAGNAGNLEYLVWLSAGSGTNPTEWIQRIAALA
ncbi:23S rRNA (cytidine1920-2'-O)/16S rRNA (cytidine1409-2'-O)-methyltransferase [Glaciihabitans tibetensis]|uniref:23S rRNA (Cytidine1920-2'-O)/16S rRNA (Cytidine1409-2'-O)-methyltransferase n=1 Tax=Glaciihabitans tibetensis TaxID=1266600 RepID=A0A2T0VEN0_9MICO|nr:TlyA family RNA methyltransferase [Glaciihabitans tibetensis]PRY68645.1 23S rRNA (cytidine1920-2'-O)/16S rRNA (cytidine1409-2'-O)-methyltransferase [Glaciihabitans tibetensis]